MPTKYLFNIPILQIIFSAECPYCQPKNVIKCLSFSTSKVLFDFSCDTVLLPWSYGIVFLYSFCSNVTCLFLSCHFITAVSYKLLPCRWFCMCIITSISFLLRHLTQPAFLMHLLLISQCKINDRLCCTLIKKTGSICSTQKASLSHMKLHIIYSKQYLDIFPWKAESKYAGSKGYK